MPGNTGNISWKPWLRRAIPYGKYLAGEEVGAKRFTGSAGGHHTIQPGPRPCGSALLTRNPASPGCSGELPAFTPEFLRFRDLTRNPETRKRETVPIRNPFAALAFKIMTDEEKVDLPSRLFRHPQGRAGSLQFHQRQARAGRPPLPDACQQKERVPEVRPGYHRGPRF